jgi:CP family cyanate transporter-like MFS transporter
MIASAMRADRIGPDARVTLIVVLLAVMVGATGLVMLGEIAGIAVAAVGVLVGIGAQLAAIGTMHAAVVDRAPGAVARATGVTMTGYYIGALVSPAAFGALADATDTFAWSWTATATLLLCAMPTWVIAARVTGAGSTGAMSLD